MNKGVTSAAALASVTERVSACAKCELLSNMMLTALHTNPGSSSVFALHSNLAPSNSAQQDQTNHTPRIDGIAQCAMNKSSSATPPPSTSSSSATPSTSNYQGFTPQLIPMATVPPPHVLINPAGGYTILPSITSLGGADGTTVGSLTSLHPIAGGFAQPSANTVGISTASASPITAIQATYYPSSHHPSPPTPGESRGGGAASAAASSSGGGAGDIYQNCSSPIARQIASETTVTTNTTPVVLQRSHAEHPSPHSRTGQGQSQLMQNGNQTLSSLQAPSESKLSMNSLLIHQQDVSPLRSSRVASNGVLTSSSSDPSLHHSSNSIGGSVEQLLDPSSTSSASYDSGRLSHNGSRRSSHNNATTMHLSGAPIEIKREPDDSPGVLQSCSRRHSDSSNSAAVVVEGSSTAASTSLGSTTAMSSKSSPYPVSALIDVPMITPLNRSSRTSSLSSSLSSFRFGGSLSQLWASQISGKISNMKSTGYVNKSVLINN